MVLGHSKWVYKTQEKVLWESTLGAPNIPYVHCLRGGGGHAGHQLWELPPELAAHAAEDDKVHRARDTHEGMDHHDNKVGYFVIHQVDRLNKMDMY